MAFVNVKSPAFLECILGSGIVYFFVKKPYRIVIAEDYTILRYISVKTVEKHRANLMKKLRLHNASALTAFAIKKGLITE